MTIASMIRETIDLLENRAVLYHVAPLAVAGDIERYGIWPLFRQHYGDTEEATQAWLARWAKRMGRDVDDVEHLVSTADYDIHRVCAFDDLETAKAWAEAEGEPMAIFAINTENYDWRPDRLADESETGAYETTEAISPKDIKRVV